MKDVEYATLVVRYRDGRENSFRVGPDDAITMLDAVKEQRKRRKGVGSEEFDRSAWSMHMVGMGIATIADALGCSQRSVKNAIGRVKSGRYDSEGWV